METKDSIYFYGLKDEYGYLSNFYKCNFIDEYNNQYCCSEQYFMYQKALLFEPDNIELHQQILNETNPTIVKKLGRNIKNYNEDIWNELRYNKMKDGLRLKFNQNDNLKIKLINTGNKILYEASKYDKIWGIGFYANEAINKNKKIYGQNLLGKCLMEIRTELNN